MRNLVMAIVLGLLAGQLSAEVSFGVRRALLKTIRSGDLVKFKKLLTKYEVATDSVVQGGGSTLLHEASAVGQIDIINYLLDSGVDANILSSYGSTPFDEAEVAGQQEAMSLLEKHGGHRGHGEVSEKNSELDSGEDLILGWTSRIEEVIEAMRRGLSATKLQKMIDPADVDVWRFYEVFPFDALVHTIVAKDLVNEFRDAGLWTRYAKIKDRNGTTFLHIALRYQYSELAIILLESGSDPNARRKRSRTHRADETPIESAASGQQIELFDDLIAAGARADLFGSGIINWLLSDRKIPLNHPDHPRTSEQLLADKALAEETASMISPLLDESDATETLRQVLIIDNERWGRWPADEKMIKALSEKVFKNGIVPEIETMQHALNTRNDQAFKVMAKAVAPNIDLDKLELTRYGRNFPRSKNY